MKRLALTFSALALAGCTTYYEPAPPGAVTTTSGAPVVSAGSSVSPSAPVVAAAPVASAPVTPAPAAPPASSAYRAGFGIIESVSLVTLPASAAAGGTLPPVTSGPYRMTVRMDDGSIQTIVLDNRTLLVGDRVQVMSDGRLLRQ